MYINVYMYLCVYICGHMYLCINLYIFLVHKHDTSGKSMEAGHAFGHRDVSTQYMKR